MGIYETGQALCRLILSGVYRAEIIGKENLPSEGPLILCCNHISNFDPPLLGSYLTRKIHYMAKEELFKVPLFGSLLNKLGAFPVKRGLSDKQALRSGLAILKEGGVLGLFPEGTRSKTGELGKGLGGAGFFALRSEATVVPCAIIGPYKAFRKVKMVYGKPINMAQLREEKKSATEATDYIMLEISKLIETYKS